MVLLLELCRLLLFLPNNNSSRYLLTAYYRPETLPVLQGWTRAESSFGRCVPGRRKDEMRDWIGKGGQANEGSPAEVIAMGKGLASPGTPECRGPPRSAPHLQAWLLLCPSGVRDDPRVTVLLHFWTILTGAKRLLLPGANPEAENLKVWAWEGTFQGGRFLCFTARAYYLENLICVSILSTFSSRVRLCQEKEDFLSLL